MSIRPCPTPTTIDVSTSVPPRESPRPSDPTASVTRDTGTVTASAHGWSRGASSAIAAIAATETTPKRVPTSPSDRSCAFWNSRSRIVKTPQNWPNDQYAARRGAAARRTSDVVVRGPARRMARVWRDVARGSTPSLLRQRRLDRRLRTAIRLRDHGGWRGPAGRPREALRGFHGRLRHQPADAAGRVLLAARPLRLRQDHHVADDRRVRAPDRGADPAGRGGRRAGSAAQAGRQHRVPELRVVPASVRGRQRRVRAQVPEDLPARGARARRERAGAGPDEPVRRPATVAAVGRSAAARRAGAGPDPQPQGAAAGRA